MRAKPQSDIMIYWGSFGPWYSSSIGNTIYDKAGLDVYYIDFILGTEKKIQWTGMEPAEPGPNAHNDLIEGMRRSGNWDEVIISSSEYTTSAHS